MKSRRPRALHLSRKSTSGSPVKRRAVADRLRSSSLSEPQLGQDARTDERPDSGARSTRRTAAFWDSDSRTKAAPVSPNRQSRSCSSCVIHEGPGVVKVRVLLWSFAGSRTSVRLGRGLQSSIRSRGADQCVVRCPGAQSRPAAVLSRAWRRPDTGASSPGLAPRALMVSASFWSTSGGHAALACSSSMSCSARARHRISPSRSPW